MTQKNVSLKCEPSSEYFCEVVVLKLRTLSIQVDQVAQTPQRWFGVWEFGFRV